MDGRIARQDAHRKSTQGEKMGPLSGLKVLDLTHVMAGPTCTLMLADMGADVIKIERNPAGDDSRHSVPPKIGDEAASFLMMNRNKRGIVVDLKTAGGKKIMRRLIASADVLVENFAPGVMDRLGFGYQELKNDHPALIYCSPCGVRERRRRDHQFRRRPARTRGYRRPDAPRAPRTPGGTYPVPAVPRLERAPAASRGIARRGNLRPEFRAGLDTPHRRHARRRHHAQGIPRLSRAFRRADRLSVTGSASS
jgi:hypothetical protein